MSKLPTMIPESMVVLFGCDMVLTGRIVEGGNLTICEEGRLHVHGHAVACIDH